MGNYDISTAEEYTGKEVLSIHETSQLLSFKTTTLFKEFL